MKPQSRYQPGDRIGSRYQVHKALMGGMGEVYLCLDLETHYPYALKTFQQRYLTDSQGIRSAFEQEVATWVALEKHPNIVHCILMQIYDSQPFMVLEWIAGEEERGTDLRGWLRHGPLDLKQALEIAIDICRGLLHAQEKQPGMVHRDLKPENILIAQDGLAKITDFGLAQIVEAVQRKVYSASDESGSRHSIFRQREVAGTPAYMAPEQWRGEPLDERTDIYALGCILYEMLAGTPPFMVKSMPTTLQQLEHWQRSMRSLHLTASLPNLPSTLPDTMNELLRNCLEKAQAERPVLTDLSNHLAELYHLYFNQPPPARPEAGIFTANDYNNRGFTYHNLALLPNAFQDYCAAIALDNELTYAYYNRGTIYYGMERYREALADFNRTIDLDPYLSQAYNNRGATHRKMRHFQAAIQDYEKASELDPADSFPPFNIGIILWLDNRDRQGAIPHFAKAWKMGHPRAEGLLKEAQQEAAPDGSKTSNSNIQRIVVEALQVIQQTQSRTEMYQHVLDLPILSDPGFIATFEQVVQQQSSPEAEAYFQTRLDWLCQTIDDLGRRKSR